MPTSTLPFALRPSPRPQNMLNDDLLNSMTWGDLEKAFTEIACEVKQPYVGETTTSLWNHSQFWSERLTLAQILVAGAWLIHPEFTPGTPAEPVSPS